MTPVSDIGLKRSPERTSKNKERVTSAGPEKGRMRNRGALEEDGRKVAPVTYGKYR
jgi:hypothetical protein